MRSYAFILRVSSWHDDQLNTAADLLRVNRFSLADT
jgi:hypothetical protein